MPVEYLANSRTWHIRCQSTSPASSPSPLLRCCDFPPPTMLCADSVSVFAWFPLSGLSFSPASPLTHCIWLNSFSPIKVQFRCHLLQVAFQPLPPQGTAHFPCVPTTSCIYPLCLTYCIIRITFMCSSPLLGCELQQAEIIFSISFYLYYLTSHTDLFNMCFLRK